MTHDKENAMLFLEKYRRIGTGPIADGLPLPEVSMYAVHFHCFRGDKRAQIGTMVHDLDSGEYRRVTGAVAKQIAGEHSLTRNAPSLPNVFQSVTPQWTRQPSRAGSVDSDSVSSVSNDSCNLTRPNVGHYKSGKSSLVRGMTITGYDIRHSGNVASGNLPARPRANRKRKRITTLDSGWEGKFKFSLQ